MDSARKKINPFEQTVLRFLQRHHLTGLNVLVAVSGGIDSIVLLYALWRLKAVARLDIAAAYVHHGKSTKTSQTRYRDRAQKFVQKFCAKHDIEFLTNSTDEIPTGTGEAELRKFRHSILTGFAQQRSATIFLAHHQDDLVETQLLRLIRGTGPQGLKGFLEVGEGKARPFVQFRKTQIVQYAKLMKLIAEEDPSNKSDEPMRNWLRQTWLKSLEKRGAGLFGSLARSLTLIATEGQCPEAIVNGRIDSAAFIQLTRDQKEAVLARYMRQQNIQGYQASHIREICKRLASRNLDSARGEHNFRLLRRQWHINAQHIFCEPSPRRATLEEL